MFLSVSLSSVLCSLFALSPFSMMRNLLPLLLYPLHSSHYIRPIPLQPLHYSHYIITITLSPLHYSHYIIAITLQPLDQSHYIIVNLITLQPLHCSHYIIAVTLQPSHYLKLCYIITVHTRGAVLDVICSEDSEYDDGYVSCELYPKHLLMSYSPIFTAHIKQRHILHEKKTGGSLEQEVGNRKRVSCHLVIGECCGDLCKHQCKMC